MVLRLGRFFARSTTTTRVPIWGPSTVMSENIPAVWLRGIFVLDAMASICRGSSSGGLRSGWVGARGGVQVEATKGGAAIVYLPASPLFGRGAAPRTKKWCGQETQDPKMGSENSNEKENKKMADEDPD